MGVIDYSGGYVIHVSSGTAGFVGAAWIGPRLLQDREDFQPNNVLMVLVGAGILWIGWNGFNGGDPYAASVDAGVAVLNTNVCTAVSLLNMDNPRCSLLQEASRHWRSPGSHHRPRCHNACSRCDRLLGRYLHGHPLGFNSLDFSEYHEQKAALHAKGRRHSGGCPYSFSCRLRGRYLHRRLRNAGWVCGLWTDQSRGAIAGNWRQIWLQLVGALFVIGLNIVMTSLILGLLQFVVPLRMSEAALLIGDDAIHGEAAYALFHDGQRSLLYGDTSPRPINGDGELGRVEIIEGQAPAGRVQIPASSSGKDSPVLGDVNSGDVKRE